MDIKLHEKMICRTPAYSYQDQLSDKWDDLKQLIFEVSPDFFDIIKDLGHHELEAIPDKIKLTIWKYFNRAGYRPTPFGGFAAVSICTNTKAGKRNLIVKAETDTLLLPDWKQAIENWHRSRLAFDDNTLVQSNGSLYRVGNEYRYIRSQAESFQLASVAASVFIVSIIEIADSTISIAELTMLIAEKFHYHPKEIHHALRQLLEQEVIFSDQLPNINGDDYFKRLRIPIPISRIHYRIDSRKVVNGQLERSDFDILPELFHFWREVSHQKQPSGLQDFRLAFKRRFGNDAVPLAHALDPEIGIGYDKLGDSLIYRPDLKFASLPNLASDRSNIDLVSPDKDLQLFLINGIIDRRPIRLEEFTGRKTQVSSPFPNTFSVLASLHDDILMIENAGGATANSLLGRFTLVNEDFGQYAKELAAIEQEANPEVIFFEIACNIEEQVDNVNRRNSAYSAEFPILSWPSKNDSLKLSDINVQVRGEEIVIWSVKHQKRLMPRLSSAYNFNRSSLALFRFLCDLQYQHLTTQLSFKLSDLIKGCKSYPRVYYKNVIISPAMWTVPNNFRNIASKDIRSKIPEFTEWVCTNNISRHFKFGIHDQTLVFDTHNESDIAFFLAIIKSHKSSLPLITETSSSASSVRDDQGKPLHSQLLLTYYHRDKIFEPLSFLPHAVEPVETTAYLPGSLWFYFEIYCHPIRSNDLLVHELSSLLNNVRPWVQKWFFVRYDYPSPHIRVRIKLKDKHSISKLIWRLEKTFRVALGNRMITDLQIKTYFPELQRYGRAGIDLTETIFYEDSEYVLKLLHADLPVQLLYEYNLKFMYASFVCQTQDIDNMIRLAERIAESFAVELNLTIDDFKKINNDFNQLIPIANMELPRSIHIDNYLAFLKIALESFDQRCDAEAFVVDLVHMHVNRLFQDHQRTHEAILYQFLTKYLKMMRARSKSLSE